MSQRTGVGLLAFGLMAVLWVVAGFTPLPFVVYSPGPTVDILASPAGRETVQVKGARSYHDDGQLRLTTIYVSPPEEHVTLPELVRAYFDDEAAVYPRSAVYAPNTTDESSDRASEIAMTSSQDNAIAVALTQLGHEVEKKTVVVEVMEDMPATGKLRTGDVVLTVGLIPIAKPQDLVDAVMLVEPGERVTFKVLRDGEEQKIDITPREVDGRQMVGIVPGERHDFPFDVSVEISDNIGGPSAGMMMALAVYDTLTEGSLTDGRVVAGSGTIDGEGKVGPIGGVQQKIVAARDTGSDLFLMSADNCDTLGGVDPGDMRVAKVSTLADALDVIETWTQDSDADLPSCEDETP